MKFILHYRIIFVIVFTVFLSSCEKDSCILGSGPIVSETLDIQEINGFDLFGSFNVVLKYGEQQKITAISQQNIISHINTKVENGIWKVSLEQGCYNDYQLTIEIEVPDIIEFGISGSGSIQVIDKFDSLSNLNIFNSGSGIIFASDSLIIADYLNIDVQGNGEINLKGSVPNQNITISGSGNYKAFNLLSDACVISLSGSGKCEINALNTLDIFLSGSGNIYYQGSPVINSNITGSGNVINAN